MFTDKIFHFICIEVTESSPPKDEANSVILSIFSICPCVLNHKWLHKAFQQAITVPSSKLYIALFMTIIASRIVNDFQQSKTHSQVYINCLNKYMPCISSLMHLIIPWSNGWSKDIVFGCKNTNIFICNKLFLKKNSFTFVNNSRFYHMPKTKVKQPLNVLKPKTCQAVLWM